MAVQKGRIIEVVRYCDGDVLATVHVYACINGRVQVECVPERVESA